MMFNIVGNLFGSVVGTVGDVVKKDSDELEEICFEFRSKNNELITFDEREMLVITKTVKRIVRTYLKMKDLFSFNFKKVGNNV